MQLVEVSKAPRLVFFISSDNLDPLLCVTPELIWYVGIRLRIVENLQPRQMLQVDSFPSTYYTKRSLIFCHKFDHYLYIYETCSSSTRYLIFQTQVARACIKYRHCLLHKEWNQIELVFSSNGSLKLKHAHTVKGPSQSWVHLFPLRIRNLIFEKNKTVDTYLLPRQSTTSVPKPSALVGPESRSAKCSWSIFTWFAGSTVPQECCHILSIPKSCGLHTAALCPPQSSARCWNKWP